MKTIVTIIAVLALIIVGGGYYAGTQVERATQAVGSSVLGAPVSVKGISLSLLQGELKVNGLVVGNPEGFSAPEAFSLNNVQLVIDTASLLSDTVKVKSVRITDPSLTLEITQNGTNLKRLSDNAKRFVQNAQNLTQGEGSQAEGAQTAQSSTKVVIDEVVIENTKLTLVSDLLGGKEQSANLPTITLANIGSESQPADVAVAIDQVLAAIMQQAAQVNLAQFEGLLDNLGNVEPAGSADAIKGALQEKMGKAADSLKGVFGGSNEGQQ